MREKEKAAQKSRQVCAKDKDKVRAEKEEKFFPSF